MNLPGGRRSVLALVLLLLAVGVGAALVLGGDDDEDDDALGTTTTTTTVGPFDDTTTTVAGGTATTTAAATTTTRATTTTTTRAGATTTTAAGGPSTTVAASPSSCGTGQASMAFAAKDLVTDAISSAFTPQATVDNQVSQPIEVEEIVLEIVYPGNDVRTVRFTTAGTVIGPGTSASFTADRLSTARRYEQARFTRFTYFTQGRQATCRVTTP